MESLFWKTVPRPLLISSLTRVPSLPSTQKGIQYGSLFSEMDTPYPVLWVSVVLVVSIIVRWVSDLGLPPQMRLRISFARSTENG